MKLRTVIKSLLEKVTSEDLNKKHGSPINLEVGDDGITWAIVLMMDRLEATGVV